MALINDFVLQSGWSYAGTCGCSFNMHKYFNSNYPKWEIRIAVNNSGTFQFRNDGIIKKSGKGEQQLKAMYYETFK